MGQQDFTDQHFGWFGSEIDFPLIEDFGYNDWHEAASLNWHSHKGQELLLVLSGGAVYEFEDGLTTVSGGQFFFAGRGKKHRGAHDVNSPSKMFWIVFDTLQPNAMVGSSFGSNDLERIGSFCEDVHRHVYAIAPQTKALLNTFRDEIQLQKPDNATVTSSARMRTLICQILIESIMSVGSSPLSDRSAFVARAKQILEKDYANPLDMQQLAKKIGVSRSYLCSIFKADTGHTLVDYLTRTRIDQAKSKLITTDLTITDVALASGFNSSQDFSEVFRKYVGTQPTKFRSTSKTVRTFPI